MSAAEFLAFQQGGGRQKDAARVLTGRNARAQGDNFEKMLDLAHAAYIHTGIASMDRLPVPTNPMPAKYLADKSMTGRARMLAKKQGFDFYGSMGPAPIGGLLLGRAVAMEAKATQNFTTSLGISKDGPVRPHQVEALAVKYEQFGTMSALVWKNGDLRGVMLGPQLVHAWRDYRIGNRLSLPWSAFTAYPVHAIDAGGPIEDWLRPVIELATQEALR